MKYGALLLGMMTSFYIITNEIKVDKKFLSIILIWFIIGFLWMWANIGCYNNFLFTIFWIMATLGVGAIVYKDKLMLKLTRYNIVFIIILLISGWLEYYSSRRAFVSIIFGIFILFYVFYIPYITGMKEIWSESKFRLYFFSWIIIFFLGSFQAPETFILFQSIANDITLHKLITKFVILPHQTQTTILDLFAKWLMIGYMWLLIIYIFLFFVNKEDIQTNNTRIEKMIASKVWDPNFNPIELLQGIILIVSILTINHFLHIINEYTLISLILFINLGVYNRLLMKRRDKSKNKQIKT